MEGDSRNILGDGLCIPRAAIAAESRAAQGYPAISTPPDCAKFRLAQTDMTNNVARKEMIKKLTAMTIHKNASEPTIQEIANVISKLKDASFTFPLPQELYLSDALWTFGSTRLVECANLDSTLYPELVGGQQLQTPPGFCRVLRLLEGVEILDINNLSAITEAHASPNFITVDVQAGGNHCTLLNSCDGLTEQRDWDDCKSRAVHTFSQHLHNHVVSYYCLFMTHS